MRQTITFLFLLLKFSVYSQEKFTYIQKQIDKVDSTVNVIDSFKESESLIIPIHLDSSDQRFPETQAVVICKWYSDSSMLLYYKKEDRWGSHSKTFYYQDSLIFVREEIFELIGSNGPNNYESKFHGDYYFENKKIKYNKLEGQTQFINQFSDSYQRLNSEFKTYFSQIEKKR